MKNLRLAAAIFCFCSSLCAAPQIIFSGPLGREDVNAALDKAMELVKIGHADVSVKYSISMGHQSLWVTLNFLSDACAAPFIKFYNESTRQLYVIKDGAHRPGFVPL